MIGLASYMASQKNKLLAPLGAHDTFGSDVVDRVNGRIPLKECT